MKRIIEIKEIKAKAFTPATKGEITKNRISSINNMLEAAISGLKVGQKIEVEGSAYGRKLCLCSLGVAYLQWKAPAIYGSLMIDLDGIVCTNLNYRSEQSWKVVE